MTLIFNRLPEIVKVHVHASAGSRIKKDTQKTHVTSTIEYDFEIQQGSRGCQVAEQQVRAKFHQAKCSGS